MAFAEIEKRRYYHSSQLFRFCKNTLEQRYEENVRVIDQDVGSLLEFDPADCSHWKKGKKHIHSLESIFKIADELKMDPDTIRQIALGELKLEEASYVISGYGPFELSFAVKERLKKNLYEAGLGESALVSASLQIDQRALNGLVDDVLEAAGIKDGPVFLGEITAKYPNFRITHDPKGDYFLVRVADGGGFEISHADHPIPVHVRYQIAKQLFNYLITSEGALSELKLQTSPEPVLEVYRNLFALGILIPVNLVIKDIALTVVDDDFIGSLAQRFWVAKPLAAQRVREIVVQYVESA